MSGDEIRTRVDSIIRRVAVAYSTRYVGQTKRDDWECDAWVVTFTPPGRPGVEFEFFTGLGLRHDATLANQSTARQQFPGLTPRDIQNRTHYGRRYFAALESLRKPKPPHAADILHSVILDRSACEQSFRDWCAEFGYSDDSIKALDTYRACQDNAGKLRRVFDSETLARLADAVSEY